MRCVDSVTHAAGARTPGCPAPRPLPCGRANARVGPASTSGPAPLAQRPAAGFARLECRGGLRVSMRIGAGVARAAIRAHATLATRARLTGTARAVIRVRPGVKLRLDPRVVYTAEGDVLDEICWRRYGRADVVPMVLAANPGLADVAPVLPAGIPIVFPDRPPVSRTMPAGRLWDAAPAWIVLPERRESNVRLGGTFRAAIRAQG